MNSRACACDLNVLECVKLLFFERVLRHAINIPRSKPRTVAKTKKMYDVIGLVLITQDYYCCRVLIGMLFAREIHTIISGGINAV